MRPRCFCSPFNIVISVAIPLVPPKNLDDEKVGDLAPLSQRISIF